ncbi:MAG: heme exporter protein CcmD [Halioglobus sp.]|nr:heme exporter protein CcmD [Halioglobus sp.]
MYFNTVQALLMMDGHGVYVWPAYLITAVIIVMLLVAPMRRRSRLLQRLAAEVRRAERKTVAGVRGGQ